MRQTSLPRILSGCVANFNDQRRICDVITIVCRLHTSDDGAFDWLGVTGNKVYARDYGDGCPDVLPVHSRHF